MPKSKRPRIPYPRRKLLSLGEVRSFEGSALSQIAFPLGGIGTGTVSLGGRGNLMDWEIFNRPGKGKTLPMTFFAIWAKESNRPPVVRVIESQILPPYPGGFGINRNIAPGLPRLKDAKFYGEYPFATVKFFDDKLPVKATLEAFNPFIPLNHKDSSLPVAILRYKLHNSSKKAVKATVVGSLFNPVGYNGVGNLGGYNANFFGGNLNELVQDENLVGLKLTSAKYPTDDSRFGSMALASLWDKFTAQTHWARGAWFDDLQIFWDDFCEDGMLNPVETSPSPEGRSDSASLALMATLSPGEEVNLTFAICWNFPIRLNEWNREESVRNKPLKNYYATQFSDAWEVAKYTLENLKRLESESRAFHKALFSSTLPPYVLDAVSSQASIIRTNTCLRTEDGVFHAFEGCGVEGGCCPMNCTHVWNYEQALAHLFPDLERSMRLTDFLSNTMETGHMAFRTLLPLGGETWKFKPAADGQMGCIMKLYREWLLSGDLEFLRELWPYAKKALEFAWSENGWDADKDGVMEGEQHNTYDIEFYGPNTMMGSFYLGALLAASKMAQAVGDDRSAQEYQKLFEKGKVRLDKGLWNSEYYVQKYDEAQAPKYQYGKGCLSDQLLGQWFAAVVGLGYLLPPSRVKKALASIFKYNFLSSFEEHSNCQRTYALSDEAGLLLCSWPKGGRPSLPFVYSDEVWTGIEYQVAAHLIYEGLLLEGLSLVKAVRDRYDGRRRNPWNEVECGDHYARAMASWSVLLALSGYRYSAIDKRISFAPQLNPKGFRCFWSTASGWGRFAQGISKNLQTHSIDVLYGNLELQSFGFKWRGKKSEPTAAIAQKGRQKISAEILRSTESKGYFILNFESPVDILSGERLTVKAWS